MHDLRDPSKNNDLSDGSDPMTHNPLPLACFVKVKCKTSREVKDFLDLLLLPHFLSTHADRQGADISVRLTVCL